MEQGAILDAGPMNIWIVNHYAATPGQSGGNRHFSLARELVRRGHLVTIIASSFNHQTRLETRPLRSGLPDIEEIERVRFWWMKTPAYAEGAIKRLWSMFAFARILRRTRFENQVGAPDVIIGSSPHLPGAVAALAMARRVGCPFVLEIRDLWPQTFVDLGTASPRHPLVWYFKRLELRLYHSATAIITLLPGAESHIKSIAPQCGPVVWIPNGVQVDPGKPPTHDACTPFTVAYCGSHGMANGLDTILEAAEIVQQQERSPNGLSVRFEFVGEGPEKPALMELAQRKHLGNVTFFPAIAKTEVREWLSARSACVVNIKNSPLYKYGMSLNKIFDYMLSGRPTVIASGAINNPISDSGGGIAVAPDDAAGIAQAVIHLARMAPAQRDAMGSRARDFVLSRYSAEMLADRLEAVLINSLGRAGGST